jgi:hypothetical protein
MEVAEMEAEAGTPKVKVPGPRQIPGSGGMWAVAAGKGKEGFRWERPPAAGHLPERPLAGLSGFKPVS